MNIAQLAKFHVLKSQWAKARTAAGRPADEAALAALKVRTIGRDCSSKAFSQADLDRMVAAFNAEIAPGDFNAQMAQQEQPENRRAAWLKKCDAACGEMANSGGESQFFKAETRRKYIAGLAQRLCGKWPEACSEQELAKVAGVLEARVKQLQRALAKHTESLRGVAVSGGDEEADCPF